MARGPQRSRGQAVRVGGRTPFCKGGQNELTRESAERITEADYEFDRDDSCNLGSRFRARRDNRGEHSAAGAAARTGAAGGRAEIRAPDLLRALGVHRDRPGAVCGAVFRVRAGPGGSERDGTVPERIHGGVLASPNRAADFLLRRRSAAGETGAREGFWRGVDRAGGDLWDGGTQAREVRRDEETNIGAADFPILDAKNAASLGHPARK